MKEIISTQAAPAAIGPYSQAVRADGLVFISGQIPVNPATGRIEAQGVEAQTEQSLRNLGAILQEAGMDYVNVLKTTVYMTDMADFAAMNGVYARYFADKAPARSAVAVKDLPKGALVEIEAIAAQ